MWSVHSERTIRLCSIWEMHSVTKITLGRDGNQHHEIINATGLRVGLMGRKTEAMGRRWPGVPPTQTASDCNCEIFLPICTAFRHAAAHDSHPPHASRPRPL